VHRVKLQIFILLHFELIGFFSITNQIGNKL